MAYGLQSSLMPCFANAIAKTQHSANTIWCQCGEFQWVEQFKRWRGFLSPPGQLGL